MVLIFLFLGIVFILEDSCKLDLDFTLLLLEELLTLLRVALKLLKSLFLHQEHLLFSSEIHFILLELKTLGVNLIGLRN